MPRASDTAGFPRSGALPDSAPNLRANRRIVLTTFRTLGDLHPFLALALGLRERGHQPVIATSACYREKIEAQGIEFARARPEMRDPMSDPDLVRKVVDLRRGSRFVIHTVMSAVHNAYADVLAAARGADLLVSHPMTFGTPLVAEKLGIPWASSMLAPMGFFSIHDPPVLPPAQWLKVLRPLGPGFWNALLGTARWGMRRWSAPCRRLRAEIGLPATRRDPLFEGQHSPHLVLALFSSVLGEKQPDWPAVTEITGFARYDEHAVLSPELERFLNDGEPPLVFTLGSFAVMDAGSFYAQAAQASARLKRRAVLLVGSDDRNRPSDLSDGVITCDYAPHSSLFPRAAAIMHQGGAGTTAEALRSGRPMLVMPCAYDQPDNADRCVRLGVARTISRHGATPRRLECELRRLLDDCRYTRRADEVGRQVRTEDGVAAACSAIERLLQAVARGASQDSAQPPNVTPFTPVLPQE